MTDPYLPIEDHGAIGDLRSAALVGRDGAISWCCLPHLDSPSVFASLLDHRRGGRFRVHHAGVGVGEQRYVEDTNVLETIFDGPRGRLVVTDSIPIGDSPNGPGPAPGAPSLHRLLTAEGGPVEVEVEWAPRLNYGRTPTEVAPLGTSVLARCGTETLTLEGLPDTCDVHHDGVGPVVRSSFRLGPGASAALVCRWGVRPGRDGTIGVERVERALECTVEAWRAWLHAGNLDVEREWAEPYGDLVKRSELTLKLLSRADTGAIAAAVTTSLPEEIGGVRNWDYRYSWIRDAGLAAQALYALGHPGDGHAFIEWAERAARHRDREGGTLKIVYGLDGSTDLPESDLVNLEGYRRSSPVRIGNGAAEQLQLDIYGELISAAYELVRFGDELPPDIREFLPQVADEACMHWSEPDYGIWELRNGPMHFVYSKVMAWMALDRALRLADDGVIDGPVEAWRSSAAAIREEVLRCGWDEELGSFRQTYDRAAHDASNLLIPLMEFLPVDDPRVQRMIDSTTEALGENGLLRRYVIDDGVAGHEGSFMLCNFWLVDALALSGRVDEASERLDRLAGLANHLGLYSEMVDPGDGTFLGNFPQGFTHVGFINSSLYLAAAQGREIPVPDLIGSEGHRSSREARSG
jgi:GH15 family glucan-1,4-alpha-glucosidase